VKIVSFRANFFRPPSKMPSRGCCDYISDLAWSRLGVESLEQSEVAENRKVFRDLLGSGP